MDRWAGRVSDRSWWGFRSGGVYAVPSLLEGVGESAAGPVLVVLLHAGGAGEVPVHEQVRPPGRGQLLRPGGAVPADGGPAGHGGEGGRAGAAGAAEAGVVAPVRRHSGSAGAGSVAGGITTEVND